MKTSNFAMLFCLFACEESTMTEEMMPIEIVVCTHPDSRYEGVVQVEIEDNKSWDDIHFEIYQGEYNWETLLRTDDHFSWWTEMHLIELDCFSDYEYDITYGDDK